MAEKEYGVDMSDWKPKTHDLHDPKKYEGENRRGSDRPKDEVFYAKESNSATEALEALLASGKSDYTATKTATDKTFKLYNRLPMHFEEHPEVHKLGNELEQLYLKFNQVDYDHKHFLDQNLPEKSVVVVKEIIAKLSELEALLKQLGNQS